MEIRKTLPVPRKSNWEQRGKIRDPVLVGGVFNPDTLQVKEIT